MSITIKPLVSKESSNFQRGIDAIKEGFKKAVTIVQEEHDARPEWYRDLNANDAFLVALGLRMAQTPVDAVEGVSKLPGLAVGMHEGKIGLASLLGDIATQLADAGSTAADRYLRREYAAAGWSAGEAGMPVLCAAQGFASIFGSIVARVAVGMAMIKGGVAVLSDGGLVLEGAGSISGGTASAALSATMGAPRPIIGLTTLMAGAKVALPGTSLGDVVLPGKGRSTVLHIKNVEDLEAVFKANRPLDRLHVLNKKEPIVGDITITNLGTTGGKPGPFGPSPTRISFRLSQGEIELGNIEIVRGATVTGQDIVHFIPVQKAPIHLEITVGGQTDLTQASRQMALAIPEQMVSVTLRPDGLSVQATIEKFVGKPLMAMSDGRINRAFELPEGLSERVREIRVTHPNLEEQLVIGKPDHYNFSLFDENGLSLGVVVDVEVLPMGYMNRFRGFMYSSE